MKRHLLALLLLLVTCHTGHAQEKEYLYEVGAGAGMSWCYGDVNASKAIYSPSIAFDLLWRYNLNLRWALACELQCAGLSGDTRDFDGAPPQGAYDFRNRFWHLQVRPEFHFWNYGWGSDYRDKRRYTPFLTMGLSAGEVTGLEDGATFAWGIPLGVGYKLKMNKRWNAQLTALFTKSFSDKLDGLTDPEGIHTSALIDNDWMASIILSVTFDFKERCVECHRAKQLGL